MVNGENERTEWFTEETLRILAPKYRQKVLSDKIIEIPIYDCEESDETDDLDKCLIGAGVVGITTFNYREITEEDQDGLLPLKISLDDGTSFYCLVGAILEGKRYTKDREIKTEGNNDKES